jgi:general secretion pathway protein I
MRRAASLKVCRRRRLGHSGERGFALLEILVAFVVLALAMGAISSGVALAMRSDGRAQSRRSALQLAQSRLEAAGVSEVLTPGHREGRVSDIYRWLETVTSVRTGGEPPAAALSATPDQAALPQAALPQAAFPQAAPLPAAFWVEVTVRVADGTVVKLGALKLSSKKPGAAS